MALRIDLVNRVSAAKAFQLRKMHDPTRFSNWVASPTANGSTRFPNRCFYRDIVTNSICGTDFRSNDILPNSRGYNSTSQSISDVNSDIFERAISDAVAFFFLFQKGKIEKIKGYEV